MSIPKVKFKVAGDRGLLMEWGDRIDSFVNERVRAVTETMENKKIDGIEEVIPSYRSVLVVFDPRRITLRTLKSRLDEINSLTADINIPTPEQIDIPVCYGGEFGPDINIVASENGLTAAEVIRLHTTPVYPVYMVGFTPGFPFLGGLPENLQTPRLKTPRTMVPAGSVGIANDQTGIYPIESPGGWQIIGRTPEKLFDPDRKSPFLIKVGNSIKFTSISPKTYRKISGGYSS